MFLFRVSRLVYGVQVDAFGVPFFSLTGFSEILQIVCQSPLSENLDSTPDKFYV